MKQSAKSNYLFNVSYQVFALLVPLVTTPYISRVLGADGIGTYSYTYSIVRYFWLLSALGIATYGTKAIGIWQESKEKRSEIFWDIFSLKAILSTVMIAAYFLYVAFIAKNKSIAAIQSIYLFGVLFDISWFYQGMEDFKKISIRNFITKILSVIFIFAFVKEKNDLPVYIIGHAGFLLLGVIIIWFPLKKYINKPNIKSLKPFKCFMPSLMLFIPSIATQIFAVLDKSMIGWLTGSMEQNGYYEQAFKIIDMIMVIVTTLSTVMIPKVSREFKNGNKDVVVKSLDTSFKFIFFLSLPMCLGVIIVSPIFVPWFFGKDFTQATSILQILSVLFIFTGLNSVTGTQYLISTNQTNKHIVMLLIGGGINVLCNFLLIPKIAANGAAIGSLAGEIVIAILEISYLQITKQYKFTNIIKSCYKFVIAVLIMSAVGFAITKFMPSTVLTMIITAVICAAIYVFALLLMREEFVLNEAKNIIKRIKKQ